MELLRPDGTTIGRASLEPDWEPAIEWSRLTGLRTLGVWAPESRAERSLEPLWHSRLGEPYMRGFRIRLASQDGVAWHEDFSVRYFGSLARAAAVQLVEAGALDTSEGFLYRALAYAHDEGSPEGPDSFTVVDHPPPLAIREASRSALMDLSAPGGDVNREDFEVFLPQTILEQASALTAGAGEMETGGVLIGHLGREPGQPDIWAEITALIPARHTVGQSTKLTFTSDTWTDVRRAVELRAESELVLGWFHSHPQYAWCREKQCPIEAQRRCSAADGFLSTDDVALHRTMFPRAFTIALLMTHSIKGIVPRLFGWRAGFLKPRGYRVVAQPAFNRGERPCHDLQCPS